MGEGVGEQRSWEGSFERYVGEGVAARAAPFFDDAKRYDCGHINALGDGRYWDRAA